MKDLIEKKKYKIINENNLKIKFIPHDYPISIRELEILIILNPKELSEIEYNKLSNEIKNLIDNNDLILGIDLGTTYSTSAIMLDEKIIVIPNSFGFRNTPSYVMFLGPNERCVGDLAKLYPLNKEKNIIFNSKRLLGKIINDIKNEDFYKALSFDLIEKNDKLKIKIKFPNDELEFFPEEISAMIIKKIIEDCEYYLSEKIGKEIKIKKAIITVPANFNQKQREATKQAAQIIDLEVIKMINEPTTASLSYAYDSIENNIKKYITVIDFGGGTLDITLLKFRKDKEYIFSNIIFSYGEQNFGGEDFDYILMEKCLGSKGFDKLLPHNIRLKRACENAKIILS